MNRLSIRPLILFCAATMLCFGPVSKGFSDEEDTNIPLVPLPWEDEVVILPVFPSPDEHEVVILPYQPLPGEDEAVILPVQPSPEEEVNPLEHYADLLFDKKGDGFYLQRIHQNAYRHIFGTSLHGEDLQMSDSSLWRIAKADQKKVVEWDKSDQIFIKPSYFCFWCPGQYSFVLHNRTTNDIAAANLAEPPVSNGKETVKIKVIDRISKLILLTDGTVWNVEGSSSKLAYWKEFDRVIIGVNNFWRTDPKPHILINADAGNYLEASIGIPN